VVGHHASATHRLHTSTPRLISTDNEQQSHVAHEPSTNGGQARLHRSANIDPSFRTLWSTLTNQGAAGRALWPTKRAGGWPSPQGRPNASCLASHFPPPSGCATVGSREPRGSLYERRGPVDNEQAIVYVTVVDRVGVHTYVMRAKDAPKYFPGLTRTTAATTLGSRPALPSGERLQLAPCDPLERGGLCVIFNGWCPYGSHSRAADSGECFLPTDRGWCGNLFTREYIDTGQGLSPEQQCDVSSWPPPRCYGD